MGYKDNFVLFYCFEASEMLTYIRMELAVQLKQELLDYFSIMLGVHVCKAILAKIVTISVFKEIWH